MSDDAKKEILGQGLDPNQLKSISGGASGEQSDVCYNTVEADSWCSSNDACVYLEIDYKGCIRGDSNCTFSYRDTN